MATATANILFSDVEGSTDLRAQLGETAADRVFVDHERLLRRVVERNRGRVVKTAGDGIMAAFDAASDAVQAAIAMQQAVARTPEGLRIRIGIAAGDVSWEDNDCFGLPVVTAARLEAAAEGGQILVSQVVRWLAGDRSEATFEALGAMDLKGLPAAIDVFAVAWEPLDEDEITAAVPLPPALAMAAAFSFVGREAERAALADAWREALAGGRRVVLLGGEAGAGKSRLAFELARQLSEDGAAVLYGGCDPQVVLPYHPWVQALDHLLRTMPVDELDPEVVADIGVLAPLLPRLDRPTPGGPATWVETESERYRLFSAMDAVLAEAAQRWPLVVVLDDLHWAGAQTLALLAHIARAGTGMRTLIVGTFRDTGDEITEALSAALADLRRLDNVTRLRIGGLAESEVASLVGEVIGQALDEDMNKLAAAVTQHSRGNPFFVGELWRQLVASGAVARKGSGWAVHASLADAGVPDSVREVVADRLARLSFQARRLAELVAVGGQRVTLPVLLGAADTNAGEVTAALDHLSRAGLLEAVEGPLLAYQFTHALVRDTVQVAIPPGSRAQLHLRVGEALEAVHEADRRPVLAALARHFTQAASLGGAGKAVYYARRAAEQAMASLGFEEAVTHLEAVVELTAPGSVARAEVLLTLGNALLHRGDFDASERVFEQAFHLAREHGQAELAGEAAIGFEDAVHSPGNPGEPAFVMVSEAIRLVGDEVTALRARLEGARARALLHSGRSAEAKAATESALDMAKRISDDSALALALSAAIIGETNPHRMLVVADQMKHVAFRLDETWYHAYGTVNELRAYMLLGELRQAHEVLRRHMAVTTRSPHPIIIVEGLCFDMMLALAEGRFADAEAAAERALEIGSDKHPGAAGQYGLQMFAIRRDQGRLAEVAPVLEAVAARGGSDGVWRPGLAVLRADLGRLDEAAEELDALAKDGFAAIARDTLWPACLTFLSEVCLAVGNRHLAQPLYDELRILDGRTLTVGYTVCFGPTERLMGGLALALGEPGVAERHFREAFELSKRAGARAWQARVEHDWARALAVAGDQRRATGLASGALEAAETLGMQALAANCRELLESAPAAPVATLYPDGLSAREVEVLRLIAAGRSNREIGEHLLISPNTAANHVRAILQKTACANRAEAAAYAARHFD